MNQTKVLRWWSEDYLFEPSSGKSTLLELTTRPVVQTDPRAGRVAVFTRGVYTGRRGVKELTIFAKSETYVSCDAKPTQ